MLSFLPLLALTSSVLGQLADQSQYPVGPLTTIQQKLDTKICNVTDYGAVADAATDIGPPLTAAFNACSAGGVVYIPSGTYNMSTFVTLSNANAWAINLEGVIQRAGNISGGNLISIENSTDFEFYSANAAGAIQGFGFEFLSQGVYGPRLLRLTDVVSFAVHDIALVDSPAFHLVMDTCSQGEVYNSIIRAANLGGLDGIDVWGFDIWIHDIEVTNKDECVTVKSPAQNILVENIYCNWSGGSAMGSLGVDTNISAVQYNNVYSQNCNQMYMFKSDGGNGTVSNVTLNNFIGHANAYSLYINSYWPELALQPGAGVTYQDITFFNWTGDCANGTQRAPLKVICPVTNPCTGITIEDFAMWTDVGDEEYYECADAYGTGYCLESGTPVVGVNSTSTSTVTATPSGWQAAYMPSDLTTGFATNSSIPIPTVPTSYFPGLTPATAIASPTS